MCRRVLFSKSNGRLVQRAWRRDIGLRPHHEEGRTMAKKQPPTGAQKAAYLASTWPMR